MHRGMTHVQRIISRYAVYVRVSGRGVVMGARINRWKEGGEGHCSGHLLVFG
jgi:hypothetical protein